MAFLWEHFNGDNVIGARWRTPLWGHCSWLKLVWLWMYSTVSMYIILFYDIQWSRICGLQVLIIVVCGRRQTVVHNNTQHQHSCTTVTDTEQRHRDPMVSPAGGGTYFWPFPHLNDGSHAQCLLCGIRTMSSWHSTWDVFSTSSHSLLPLMCGRRMHSAVIWWIQLAFPLTRN